MDTTDIIIHEWLKEVFKEPVKPIGCTMDEAIHDRLIKEGKELWISQLKQRKNLPSY